jgi:hypothetical protein
MCYDEHNRGTQEPNGTAAAPIRGCKKRRVHHKENIGSKAERQILNPHVAVRQSPF